MFLQKKKESSKQVTYTHYRVYNVTGVLQITCDGDRVVSDTQQNEIRVECLAMPKADKTYEYEWKRHNNGEDLLQCQSMSACLK